MRYPNNIRTLKDAKGWTIDEAAEAMGLSRGGFIKLERGENRLTSTTIKNAAKAFGVSEAAVVPANQQVAVVGLVGAASEASFFDDGQGPLDYVTAPDGATDKTVAVEVRGDSLGASFDRWLLFYDDRREPVTDDLLGELCVIGLDDGRVVVKTLAKGQVPKRFNLIANVGPPIYDAKVTWAALIKQMRPR